ncbi:hypothetical protein MTR67_014520 [Solanum verrucosum]|uniref:Uncharacterized protein n=1 Tax=Solanum verrucosum TaxID=315347 RepID=A0AAF0QH11_SOLVR|nr:hypothetical protein MTR67_014520 [Solanum verrucosum]
MSARMRILLGTNNGS